MREIKMASAVPALKSETLTPVTVARIAPNAAPAASSILTSPVAKHAKLKQRKFMMREVSTQHHSCARLYAAYVLSNLPSAVRKAGVCMLQMTKSRTWVLNLLGIKLLGHWRRRCWLLLG